MEEWHNSGLVKNDCRMGLVGRGVGGGVVAG